MLNRRRLCRRCWWAEPDVHTGWSPGIGRIGWLLVDCHCLCSVHPKLLKNRSDRGWDLRKITLLRSQLVDFGLGNSAAEPRFGIRGKANRSDILSCDVSLACDAQGTRQRVEEVRDGGNELRGNFDDSATACKLVDGGGEVALNFHIDGHGNSPQGRVESSDKLSTDGQHSAFFLGGGGADAAGIYPCFPLTEFPRALAPACWVVTESRMRLRTSNRPKAAPSRSARLDARLFNSVLMLG